MRVAEPVVIHFKLEHSVHIGQLELDAVFATCGGTETTRRGFSVSPTRASAAGPSSCRCPSRQYYLPFFFKKVLTKGSMRTNSSWMSSPSKGTHLPFESCSITMLYS